MPAVTAIDRARKAGEFVLLQVALPGQAARNAGVLLLDAASGELHTKIRTNWPEIAEPSNREVLELLDQDLRSKAAEMSGAGLLEWLEQTLSNVVRITPREQMRLDNFAATLNRLYSEHVEKLAVRPFETHLPLYSMQAAATKFGEDSEAEVQDWVPAPSALRLSEEMFVVLVVGRSMEPRIPDGSLCVFRANLVGSRQGKVVLVERFGVTDTSAQYSVKIYTSVKVRSGSGEDDSWQHESVWLKPLNPEFQGFELKEGECRIIAEFVQVLD